MLGAGGGGKGTTTDVAEPRRFTRAAVEHTEPSDLDETVTAAQFGAGNRTLSFDVPAYGFARWLTLYVQATLGEDLLNPAVALADAPWSVISSITFKDVNGGHIYGPVSGFDLFLTNKYGGYGFDDNPVRWPSYSAIDTDGNFAFSLNLNLEAIARDALGALPNRNSASTYRVEIVTADDSAVYSTPPDTLPGLRIRGELNAWSKPSSSDPMGNPQRVNPPFDRTTQFWTKAQFAIAGSGSVTHKLPKVGNFIRNLIFVFRDSAGLREGATYSESVQMQLDGQSLFSELTALRRDKMARTFGYELAPIATADFDEGVLVYTFNHDFDGKPGGELRDLWLPTTQASRLEFIHTAGEAGTMEVLTNDIAVASSPVTVGEG
jgi:hypothetical protein